MRLTYRPEIDGLRTLAVVSVLIYHCELFFGETHFLKGGFLGVDIFFVISGYLITSIIISEYFSTGQFSFSNFYERRARRLLPALLTVIITSLPFAWFLLTPVQLVDFSHSILSTIVFGSNFYWNYSLQQYGAESALIKPFLHTWSLAVEEQYYIIFPPLLMLLYRWWKRHTAILLSTGLILSLIFSEIMTDHDVSFSFYMLPSRFWELLAGGLLAHHLFFNQQPTDSLLLKKVMPVLGLILILYSMAFINLESGHPGIVTAFSVAGTILIIWFGSAKDVIGKALSSRLFVSIGLISYSLYLWHYPVYAYGRILNGNPTFADKSLWVLLSFALSIATYHVIERPFRKNSFISINRFVLVIIAALILIFSITIYWSKNDGFESRLRHLKEALNNAKRIWTVQDNQRCHSGGGGRKPAFPLNDSCKFVYNQNGKYIIVVGDSHAGSLSESLRLLAKDNFFNFIQLTSAGCPHVKGLYTDGICADRSNKLVEFLARYPGSIVIYNARVPLFLEIERFDNQEGGREANYKKVSRKYIEKQFPIRSQALLDTLNNLKKISEKLVIVYPVPEQGFSVSDKLFADRSLRSSESQLPVITTSYDVFKARVQRSYQVLDKITGSDVIKIFPESIFCSKSSGRCVVSDREKIYYSSDNHVSPLGSTLIVNEIARELGLKTNTASESL